MVNERATLVIALMGTVEPSPPAREVIDNALAEFNKHGARMTVKVLYAADFHDQIHADLRPEPICLDVRLDDWYQQKGPLEAFQGTVSAESVAEWYETYGANLFEQNLRAPLGPTVTNAEIGQTLTSDPTRFWHLNNGITMICTSLTAKNDSAKSPQSRPTTLSVAGVSIVNGAQTVRAVARAMHDDGEAAANATLSIKVINTHGDGGFGVQVSQAANRQNAIEQRDHIALEPVHQAIKANLRAELRKQYVIKRGEPVAAPETGCSLDELALALACLHPDAEQAARSPVPRRISGSRAPRGATPCCSNVNPLLRGCGAPYSRCALRAARSTNLAVARTVARQRPPSTVAFSLPTYSFSISTPQASMTPTSTGTARFWRKSLPLYRSWFVGSPITLSPCMGNAPRSGPRFTQGRPADSSRSWFLPTWLEAWQFPHDPRRRARHVVRTPFRSWSTDVS